MDITFLLNKLIERKNLTEHGAEQFLLETINGNVTPTQIGAILTALRIKGESSEEIYGLIKTMRNNMVHIKLKNAIDVCGAGGDGSGSFNISTAVAFVVAGAGVKVAKHGNRAASSLCGSADVLEELKVNINLTPDQAIKVFDKVGMVFLFAPIYHPALKNVAMVRKELKTKTVFNYLGPFINPSSPKRQLIGVPDELTAKKLAIAAKRFGFDHLLIVTSKDGFDEVSIADKTTAYEIKKNQLKKFVIDPGQYGFKKNIKGDLLGGSVKKNALIIKKILTGVKNIKRDIVVLNAAVALQVAGSVKNIREGIKLAENSIDQKRALLILENLVLETQKYA